MADTLSKKYRYYKININIDLKILVLLSVVCHFVYEFCVLFECHFDSVNVQVINYIIF